MNKIYWTSKYFNEEDFEDHPHKNQHCVVAITELVSGDCHCFTFNEDGNFIHKNFKTPEEAKLFVTELNKPNYYAAFKGSYELVYLEPESEEWLNLHEKWCNFIKRMNAMELWKRLPWYKKLYYKIRFKFDMFE